MEQRMSHFAIIMQVYKDILNYINQFNKRQI